MPDQKEKKKLGDMLVEAGIIDEYQLKSALASQRTWGGRIGTNLIKMGFVTEEQLVRHLSKTTGYPAINFETTAIPDNIIKLVKEDLAREHNMIPVSTKKIDNKEYIYLAMSDPTNLGAMDTVEAVTGMRVKPVIATDTGISTAIDYYYQGIGKKNTIQIEEKPIDSEILHERKWDKEEAIVYSSGEEKKVPLEARRPGTPPLDEPEVLKFGEDEPSRELKPPGEDSRAQLKETRAMVIALAKLLIEKGLFTKDEFFRRAKEEMKE